MLTSFMIDIVIIVLLAGALYHANRVYKALKAFRQDKDAFVAAVHDLNRATVQAQQAIDGLHHSANEAGEKLQKEIKEAQALFDELHFMNDAGNNLATRLEKLAGQANPVKDEADSLKKKSAAKDKKQRSRAEEGLRDAIKKKRGAPSDKIDKEMEA